MRKIVYIADFFEDQVQGGAEKYGTELISALKERGHQVKQVKSMDSAKHSLNSKAFYIVSNFKMLSEDFKQKLINEHEYIILEHDPMWDRGNNPALFQKLIIPESQLQHREFYSSAKVVLCQSELHAKATQGNLFLDNIINLGCNLWSESTLKLLEKHLNTEKTRKYAIMSSLNQNKGMSASIKYCEENKLEYDLIPFTEQEEFFKELAKTETLVFFPQWMETFCRVAIEARVLGCGLITNKALGCASEPMFELKGTALLQEIRNKRESVMSVYQNLIDGKNVKYRQISKPKVSIITTFYNAEKYIKGFLESFAEQTYKNVELLMINANSPENEEKYILPFLRSNPNVKYKRLDERKGQMECFNIALQEADGEYITICLVDDRMAKDHIETLTKHLVLDDDVSLVYGDCLQTMTANETVEKNNSHGMIYEHSRKEFSNENMIKCLPGPMPMFRKSMIETCGMFNPELDHSGDWELWLRSCRFGKIFKKIDKVVGLYYNNPQGMSTSSDPELATKRKQQEAQVFNEYKDVIGEVNFKLFEKYFNG